MGRPQGNRRIAAQLGPLTACLSLTIGSRRDELAQVQRRGLVSRGQPSAQRAGRIVEEQLVEAFALMLLGLDPRQCSIARQTRRVAEVRGKVIGVV
ncbi:hypothetical protein D3C81_1917200 [compost metagenome]